MFRKSTPFVTPSSRGLLLEYVIGGGMASVPWHEISPSLQAEAVSMLHCVAIDWSRLSNWEIDIPIDARFLPRLEAIIEQNRKAQDATAFASKLRWLPIQTQQESWSIWSDLARQSDATILIAPESDGILQQFAESIDSLTPHRIGCRGEMLLLACDKWQCAQRWHEAAVPHPPTLLPSQWHDRQPLTRCGDIDLMQCDDWIVKRRDGAGCELMLRLPTPQLRAWIENCRDPDQWIVQPWIAGKACSVAIWWDDRGPFPLPPVAQHISTDTGVTYLGGSGPLPRTLWPTVHQQAIEAIEALGAGANGWVGVDFLWHEKSSPSEQHSPQITMIEVNPRWTTSYMGLREMTDGNWLEYFLNPLHQPLCQSQHQPPALDRAVQWSASAILDRSDLSDFHFPT